MHHVTRSKLVKEKKHRLATPPNYLIYYICMSLPFRVRPRDLLTPSADSTLCRRQ